VNLLRYRRPLLTGVFVTTEALAWFAVLAVLAGMTEQTFLDGLVDRLQAAVNSRQVADLGRAEVMVAELRAAQGQGAGPGWYIVIAAAFGGFLLMRLTRRLDMGGAIGAVVLVAATLLGVNLLVHLSMSNWQIWDASYITQVLSRPDAQVASRVDLDAFVASGQVRGPFGGVVGLTFVGLFATWFRFMLAARSPLRMEKIGRSFTASFMVILVTLIVARVTDTPGAGWVAVPQFGLGMLGLAVANHERAVPLSDGGERTSPWMTSVGGTLALLLGSAGLIGLLAYLQIGVVLSMLGDWFLVGLQFVIIVVVTPFAWVIERIMNWIFDGRIPELDIFRAPNLIAPPEVPEGTEMDGEGIAPQWMRDTLKFFGIVGASYGMYWIARLLLRRRDSEEEEIEEHRTTTSGGAGIGQLLGDLFALRRRRDPDRWLDRHPVYRLFASAVSVSSERGLPILPTETPQEFGESAMDYLGAEPVAEATRLFEQARYGRHYPEAEDVRQASTDLDAWDKAHPPTEEMRERVRGQRPRDEAREIALRIALAKKGISLEDEAMIRGD